MSILIRSVFKVIDSTPKEEAVSTGFFIHPDGYALTCFHALPRMVREGVYNQLKVEYSGSIFMAQYVSKYSNPVKDVAILRVEGNDFVPLPLSSRYRPGDPFVSLGYQEAAGAFIYGSIHNQHPLKRVRFADGSEQECLILVCDDQQIKEGTSGAPILNLRTEKVVAMVTGTRRRSVVGILTPARAPQRKGEYDLEIYDESEPRGFAILLSDVSEKCDSVKQMLARSELAQWWLVGIYSIQLWDAHRRHNFGGAAVLRAQLQELEKLIEFNTAVLEGILRMGDIDGASNYLRNQVRAQEELEAFHLGQSWMSLENVLGVASRNDDQVLLRQVFAQVVKSATKLGLMNTRQALNKWLPGVLRDFPLTPAGVEMHRATLLCIGQEVLLSDFKHLPKFHV